MKGTKPRTSRADAGSDPAMPKLYVGIEQAVRPPHVVADEGSYSVHALARTLCRQHAEPDGSLHVITLDPQLEEYVAGAIEHGDRGSFLRLSPEMSEPITGSLTGALERLVGAGHAPVVLTSPQIRLQVRRLLENAVPGVVVLSYNEVARGVVVESAGVARVD